MVYYLQAAVHCLRVSVLLGQLVVHLVVQSLVDQLAVHLVVQSCWTIQRAIQGVKVGGPFGGPSSGPHRGY